MQTGYAKIPVSFRHKQRDRSSYDFFRTVAEHAFRSAIEPPNCAVGSNGNDRVEGCVRDGAVACLALSQLINQPVMSRRTVH
jgi:hypothetical protein